MAKRRSRIAYVPGSRRKSSVSERNQSAVSNATRNKETNVSTSTINQDKLKVSSILNLAYINYLSLKASKFYVNNFELEKKNTQTPFVSLGIRSRGARGEGGYIRKLEWSAGDERLTLFKTKA